MLPCRDALPWSKIVSYSECIGDTLLFTCAFVFKWDKMLLRQFTPQ